MGELHIHQWNTYLSGHSLHLYKIWFKEQWNIEVYDQPLVVHLFEFLLPLPTQYHSVLRAQCGRSTQETNKLAFKVFILFIIEI